MLRHLPLTYSPDTLLAEFTAFLPFIDFYYLPTNFKTKNNLGYAFVNFTDRDAAAQFKAFWLECGIPDAPDFARRRWWTREIRATRRTSSASGIRPSWAC